jgi:hypothetical protein
MSCKFVVSLVATVSFWSWVTCISVWHDAVNCGKSWFKILGIDFGCLNSFKFLNFILLTDAPIFLLSALLSDWKIKIK